MTEPPATPTGPDRPEQTGPDRSGEPGVSAGPAVLPRQTGAALRLARTPGDMAKAVLILLVPVVLAVLVYVYFFGGSNVIAIDPSGDYSAAQASAHFTVLQPEGLPSGWKPVSSAYGKVTGGSLLRVGYIAPDGAGIQLVESDRPVNDLLTDELGPTNSLATSVDLGGRTWGQLDSTTGDDHALVDTEDGRTVIVHGQASQADLQAFVASLR